MSGLVLIILVGITFAFGYSKGYADCKKNHRYVDKDDD